MPQDNSQERQSTHTNAPQAPRFPTAQELMHGNVPVVNVPEPITCHECEEPIKDDDETAEVGWHTVHQQCYDDNYFACDDCGDAHHNDEAYNDDGDTLCRSCNYDRESAREDEQEEESSSINERDWSDKDLPEFQSRDKGTIITSTRVFSAEVECYDHNENGDSISSDLPRAFGIGYDGSLNDNGIEIQTPKLQGAKGEEAIHLLCTTLDKYDCTTDRSAGLHIHLDGKGLMPRTRTKSYPKHLTQLWLFYLVTEDIIMSFLPASRRNNRYCKLMKNEYHASEIQDINTLEQLEKLWYRTTKRSDLPKRKCEKYDSSRYVGVNFHSFLKDGHLEIRYHSGTTNATKILEWINLHQTIIDRCTETDLGTQALQLQSMTNLKEKTALFYDLLRLPKRARLYWDKRQSLFNSTTANNGEAASLNEVCAG